MKGLQKGLILTSAHLALILSLAGKLLVDRAIRPRAWVKAAPVDPDLPIRGRYVSLRVEVPVTSAELPPLGPRPPYLRDSDPWPSPWTRHGLEVEVSAGPKGLMATPVRPMGQIVSDYRNNAYLRESLRALPKDQWTVELIDPLAFFIPEHVPDPSRRPTGEELWVEVTLPKKGPLRPIRLGVKKNGTLTPLPF